MRRKLPNKKLLQLSEQELIRMALDEEESLARTQGALYNNKIKQQIASYRKMPIEGWISHVKVTVIEPREKNNVKTSDPDEKVIATGLSSDDECLILPHLVADQTKLIDHGYIPTPPTIEQAAEAQAAVEASKNYELWRPLRFPFPSLPRAERRRASSHPTVPASSIRTRKYSRRRRRTTTTPRPRSPTIPAAMAS